LFARTLPHEDNIDLSIPQGEEKSERFYYGLEAIYLGIPNQGIYGYLGLPPLTGPLEELESG
ncbi:MAG TPA: hypothetical protein QGI03_16195, partial [Dehalococcoidia bacterium]|nr:hypothetical protein [Dehalococcoidia bacterium]